MNYPGCVKKYKPMGGYSDLNRELTVPHTVVLPIELHPPFIFSIYVIMLEWFEHSMVNTKNLWLTD